MKKKRKKKLGKTKMGKDFFLKKKESGVQGRFFEASRVHSWFFVESGFLWESPSSGGGQISNGFINHGEGMIYLVITLSPTEQF